MCFTLKLYDNAAATNYEIARFATQIFYIIQKHHRTVIFGDFVLNRINHHNFTTGIHTILYMYCAISLVANINVFKSQENAALRKRLVATTVIIYRTSI